MLSRQSGKIPIPRTLAIYDLFPVFFQISILANMYLSCFLFLSGLHTNIQNSWQKILTLPTTKNIICVSQYLSGRLAFYIIFESTYLWWGNYMSLIWRPIWTQNFSLMTFQRSSWFNIHIVNYLQSVSHRSHYDKSTPNKLCLPIALAYM